MSGEQAAQRVVEDLVESWNRRDGASFSRLFAEGAHYVTASGRRLVGRDQIYEALFARAPDSAEPGEVSLTMESVKILAPAAAVLLCAWHMRPGDTGRTGFVTVVLERAGDGWRIVALQNTDSAP